MDYRNKPPIQEYCLTHHGIRGQKWGKRNGPPYPLDDSDHSASEKKAGWRKSLAGSSRPESQTTTPPKWGVTEDRLSLKTKSGESITLKEHPSSRMASFLARYSKRVAEEAEKTAMFDIKGSDGKNVGDVTLYKESPTSINVVWVTTSTKVRGRGYGTAVMKAAIQIAKDTGANTVTLEVAGSSPDARHIYEKLGFKEVESPDRDVDDIWGGLTNMRLDLDQVRHSYFLAHSSGLVKISKDVAKRYASFLVKEIESLEGEDILSHHGIKGQRWGVRRYQNADGTLTAKGKARLEKKDNDWIDKRSVKITEKAQKKSAKELNQYATALLQTPGAFNKNGKLSAAAIVAYNRKMSELMSQKVSDLRTPSGKVVKFVAKRGEIGVMMALADAGYDMDQLKKGVWASGRVAYKKTVLDKVCLTFMATFAQEESRKISERVRAGQRISREKGVLYGTGNILGYDRIDGTYAINPEQAYTVQKFFNLYAAGWGYKSICAELIRLGCENTFVIVKWEVYRIGQILKNATYKGYLVYNKSTSDGYLTQKRIKNSEQDYVYVKGSFEPIVSEELWNYCESLRIKKTTIQQDSDGTLRQSGCPSSQSVWYSKLRCNCGSSFRYFLWHENLNGKQRFGYECYKKRRDVSTNVQIKLDFRDMHLCQTKDIPSWHIVLMAKIIFNAL